MNNYDKKIGLIMEMIAFSVVDGRLHQKEYDFVKLVAQELKIEKADFKELFHKELPTHVLKTEKERIEQFYRLALLMHADGYIHTEENRKIYEIAIIMGLNPEATKKILTAMDSLNSPILSEDFVFKLYKHQLN
jgi:uncharacterized tellurite resistance protein B-like protein